MPEVDFEYIKKRADELQAANIERNTLFTEMEEMYFLKWSEEGKVKRAIENTKVTLSPDPRNQIMGAVRLIVAGEPQFSIPEGLNDPAVQAVSEDIEKFCEKMWQAAGKVAGRPIHYDAGLSAMLYGEVHIAIINTDDLLKAAEGKSEAMMARTTKTAKRTPYLFEVWNPKDCYPEFDNQGLTAHYRKTETTKQHIRNEFGDDAAHIKGKGYDKVNLCEWWDLEWHIIWAEGDPLTLIKEQHELPFIPIVVGVTDGSTSLFSKGDEQRQPFLYAVAKSGLWNRQNLSLTVMFTMLHSIGANPMFVYKSSDPDNELEIDWEVPGGYAQIGPGESLEPMAKQIIDPNMWQALDVANQLTAESTIYKQTLGEPLGGNAPFSMVALLSQAGRLPLVSPQRILGWVIGSAVEMALNWLKADNRAGRAVYQGDVRELDPDMIPDDFEIEATLDVKLPQDDLQNANIANMLTEGDNPLVSKDWVRQNILKIEQPSEMVAQIWAEKAAEIKAMQYFSWQAELIQQRMAQAMTPPQPPQQTVPPGPPQQMPPGQQMPPQEELPPEPAPGQQPLEGLPPVMEQGGMQAPMDPNAPPQEMMR